MVSGLRVGLLIFVLLWIAGAVLLARSAWSANEELSHEPSLQVEVSQLERLKAKQGLNSEQRERLAELYFLTSRCGDVKALYASQKKKPPVVCACGGGCKKESGLAKLTE